MCKWDQMLLEKAHSAVAAGANSELATGWGAEAQW